ncbi:MAG TPA: hypothetical protein VFX49_23130 [Chloroflexota bacterium]|nr:hypothetical protein [Chloroflexota bacterium]
MTQHHLPYLELLVRERQRELRRSAEWHRLAAAARRAAPRRERPTAAFVRASLFRAGALLVACGLTLVRWADTPSAPRPTTAHARPTVHLLPAA